MTAGLRFTMKEAVLAALLAVAATLVVAWGVSAHARLAEAEPAPDAEVSEAPRELTLRFTQDLERRGTWVQLRDANGEDLVVSISFDDSDARLMRASVPRLGPGVYTVVWQSLSAEDGDYDGGRYTFTVLNPDGSPPRGDGVRAPQDSGGLPLTLLAAVGAVVLVGGAAIFALRYQRPA